MAVADFKSIATHGWFPIDGNVPGPAEVFTHGWYRGVEVVIITSAPNIITFVANSAKTLSYTSISSPTLTFTANSAKTLSFVVKEIL